VLLPLPANECLNLGGVRALRVWPARNVLALPTDPSQALSLRDATDYCDIFFAPDSAGFEEPEVIDAQGEFYKASLQLLIAHDAPDRQAAIARLRAVRYFVAAYTDANGLTKLVGTPDHPLRLTAGLETGKRPGDRNGYPLSFAGLTPEPALVYLLESPTTPAPAPRAFAAGFGPGFS